MEDKIHIARTQKEYKEGLKNPSKNIMYFPNANQMTMNGMKTPIKYYGITDGRITDEGYAKPGQKFNVNGVSTLEVRMPKMKYGGRATYQFGGGTPTIEINDLVNRLITAVQRDPENIQSIMANFRSLIPSYSVQELDSIVPIIIQNAQFFPNESYKLILDDINKTNNLEEMQNAEAIRRLSPTIPTDLSIEEQLNNPDILAMIERVLADPNNPNNQALLRDPKFLPLIEAYKQSTSKLKAKPITELLNNLINIIQTDPTNAEAAVANFQSLLGNYSPSDLATVLPLIKKFESQFTPNEFQEINASIINKISKRNEKTEDSYFPDNSEVTETFGPRIGNNDETYIQLYAPEGFGAGKEYATREDFLKDLDQFLKDNPKQPQRDKNGLVIYPNIIHGKNKWDEWKNNKKVVNPIVTTNTSTVPVVNTTTPPVVVAKPKFRGNAYPGYTIPDWIGTGKEYESVEDYQKAIKDFLKENPDIKYTLTGTNEGIDNVYGNTSDLFLKDPTRKAAFEKWKESKKTVSTPSLTTTVTGNTVTTTNPAEVKTEPKKDITVDNDFGKRTLRYTDGTWYMAPSGTSYRTVPMNDRGVLYEMPDGSIRKSEIIPEEVKDYWKKLPQGNYSNYESIGTFPSVRTAQKLKGAYDNLNQSFDDFSNMINSDRSDRAARRAERFLARAQAAESIGNDRQAGRLYRKADRQIARIEPLERIQDANEARKDFEAKMALDKMLKYNLAIKENRANEKRISAQAEAERTGEYWQSRGANKNSVISGNEARRREKTEGRYNRAEEDARQQTERNVIRDDSKDFRTGLNQDFKQIKNQYEEQNETDRLRNVLRNRDIRAEKRFNSEVQGVKDDYAPTPNAEQFWGESDDKSYNIFRRKKEYGGNISKYKFGGEFNKRLTYATSGGPCPNGYIRIGDDCVPSISSNTGVFTEGRKPFQQPDLQSTLDNIQMPEVKFPDYSDPKVMWDQTKKYFPGIPHSGQKFYSPSDPSFTLNFNERKGLFPKYKFDTDVVLRLPKSDENITTKTTESKGPGMGFYGFTPGEWTQFTGTMMPAFYNLAQSMRKPHKFKEFQNPYAGRYLSNLASQYLPYDDSKIVAQQNKVMRSAQQQAPNFQIAQGYQMAGMDSLNRQLKDYQMKNYMTNQDYASKYNEAAYNVAGQQQAIKAQTYENDRKAQAALNQMQHKAVTQMGIGIHDLGKLMVNREMNAMDWALMSQVYQQYGLAPFEAVMNGEVSYADMVKYKNNPVAMQEIINRAEKAKAEKAAAAKQQQTTTTEDVSNPGINASVTTTGSRKTGGKVFNLNVIKKY